MATDLLLLVKHDVRFEAGDAGEPLIADRAGEVGGCVRGLVEREVELHVKRLRAAVASVRLPRRDDIFSGFVLMLNKHTHKRKEGFRAEIEDRLGKTTKAPEGLRNSCVRGPEWTTVPITPESLRESAKNLQNTPKIQECEGCGIRPKKIEAASATYRAKTSLNTCVLKERH